VESTRTRLAPDTRRAEILEAARAAFAGSDYADVSMAAIAREAGVTPGLVNHYLGPKRDLYLTVLREVAERLEQTVRTDVGDLSDAERIELNTRQFLDSVERDREDYALLFGAQSPHDPDVARILASVRRATVERMAFNLTGDPVPSDDLRLALRMLLGAAEAGAVEWARGDATREQLHRILAAAMTAIAERARG